MAYRKYLAAFGAGLIILHLTLSAHGWDSVGQLLRTVLTDQRLIAASVSVELGAPVSDVSATAAPTPTATSIPLPLPVTPTPAPTPEILETAFPGGLMIDNSTDYALDTAALLADGPHLRLEKDQPQILIIHTHSSEAYTMDNYDRYEPSDPYRTEDTNYNIIRVGDLMAEKFTEAGLNVVHDRGIYDYPSYTGSYSRAGEAIERYLAQYPTISIVIDLHRDAIGDDEVIYKTLAESEGNPAAQVMFVVGSDASGLEHPHWQENLKLALYLQSAVDPVHPTLMRPIKLVRERYNQQLTNGSLIIEVGSNGNTLQEALTAARLFADDAGPALAKLVS